MANALVRNSADISDEELARLFRIVELGKSLRLARQALEFAKQRHARYEERAAREIEADEAELTRLRAVQS